MLNGAPDQTTQWTIHGSRDRIIDMSVTPTQRLLAAAAARTAATEGRTPTRKCQGMVYNNMRSAGGREGRPPRGGGNAQGEGGRQSSADGAPDAPGEAGRLEQSEGEG